ALVPRDDPGREHDAVTRLDRQVLEASLGEARQGRIRLALRARDEHRHLARRPASRLVEGDHARARRLQVAELGGEPGRVLEAATRDRDRAAAGGARVEDLLDAVEMRGEGRDESAARGLPHEPFDARADGLLGAAGPYLLDVRRVRAGAGDAL